jgi:serine/threonine protein kinase
LTWLKRKQFKQQAVIQVLQGILSVLKFVHQNNYIHWDAKTSNLIPRESDGKIVIINFGAVKEIHSLSYKFLGQLIIPFLTH